MFSQSGLEFLIQIFYLDFDETITTWLGASNRKDLQYGLALFEKSDEEIRALIQPGMKEALQAILDHNREIVIVTNQVFPQVIRLYLSKILTPEQLAKVKIKTADVRKNLVKDEEGRPPFFDKVEDSEILKLLEKETFTPEEAKLIADRLKETPNAILSIDKLSMIREDIEARQKEGKTLTSNSVCFFDDRQQHVQRLISNYKEMFNIHNAINIDPEFNTHVFKIFELLGMTVAHLQLQGLLEEHPVVDDNLVFLLNAMEANSEQSVKRANEGIGYPVRAGKMVYTVNASIVKTADGCYQINFPNEVLPHQRPHFSNGEHGRMKHSVRLRFEKGRLTLLGKDECTKIHFSKEDAAAFTAKVELEAERFKQCNQLPDDAVQISVKTVSHKKGTRIYQRMPNLGMSLKQALENGFWDELDDEKKIDVIHQLLNIVERMHVDMQIKHLDLTLDNIVVKLVDGTPKVSIVDFGCARSINDDRSPKRVNVSILHPDDEQTRPYRLTDKADVYAVGLVIAQLCGITAPQQATATTSPYRNSIVSNRTTNSADTKLVEIPAWDFNQVGSAFLHNHSALRDFIGYMTQLETPDERPSMAQAIDKFDSEILNNRRNHLRK